MSTLDLPVAVFAPIDDAAAVAVRGHGLRVARCRSPAELADAILAGGAHVIALGPGGDVEELELLVRALARRFPEVPIVHLRPAGTPPLDGAAAAIAWPLAGPSALTPLREPPRPPGVGEEVAQAFQRLSAFQKLRPRRRAPPRQSFEEDTLPMPEVMGSTEVLPQVSSVSLGGPSRERTVIHPMVAVGISDSDVPTGQLDEATLPAIDHAFASTEVESRGDSLEASVARDVEALRASLEGEGTPLDGEALKVLLDEQRAPAVAARLDDTPRVLLLAAELASLPEIASRLLLTGCRIEHLPNARAALRAIERTAFDIVVATPSPETRVALADLPWLERASVGRVVLVGWDEDPSLNALGTDVLVLPPGVVPEHALDLLDEVLAVARENARLRDSEGFLDFVSKPEDGASVIGPLGLVDLQEVLLSLRMSRRDALVEVFIPSGRLGTLAVREGSVVFAECAGGIGAAALASLTGVSAGWYRVRLGARLSVPDNIR